MAQNPNDYNFVPEDEPATRSGAGRWLWWLATLLVVGFLAFAGGMAFFTLNQRLPALRPTETAFIPPTNTLLNAVATVAQPVNTPTLASAQTPAQPPPQNDAQATLQVQQTQLAQTAEALAQMGTSIASTAIAATLIAAVPTSTPMPVSTATPLPAATSTTAGCQNAVDPVFAAAVTIRELGCPIDGSNIVWSAVETFERGAMFWRSDTNWAYTLVGVTTSGTWSLVSRRWNGEAIPSRSTPPSGKFAPERGFGFVWGSDDQVFNDLGWATTQELGFCARIQDFERGFVLQSSTIEYCTPDQLYNQAREPGWNPFGLVLQATDVNRGTWRTIPYREPSAGQPPAPVVNQPNTTPTQSTMQPTTTPTAGTIPANTTPQPSPTATSPNNPATGNQVRRSADHGYFAAKRGAPIALDGKFDDWPNNWIAMPNIIFGGENFSSLNDLGASFQLLWSADGLYMAVKVQDDAYRAGPEGTEMWKGDGLEIHLDRDLAGDFNDNKMNEDDFQLGMSFGPNLDQLRGYRWLPFNLETGFVGTGKATQTPDGYQVEMMLPWSLWEMNGAGLQSGQTFGFNLSVNDNDSDAPAQETMLSASPFRTTHDNPTEWGTLILE